MTVGVELPFVTRSFFATYEFWAAAPLFTTVAVFVVLRRQRSTRRQAVGVMTSGMLAGVLLHAWLQLACFAPLLTVISCPG